MHVQMDIGKNRFPEVIWVDAEKTGEAINLIFGTRIEGQGASLKVTLSPSQWGNLKFLVDRPTPNAPSAA